MRQYSLLKVWGYHIEPIRLQQTPQPTPHADWSEGESSASDKTTATHREQVSCNKRVTLRRIHCGVTTIPSAWHTGFYPPSLGTCLGSVLHNRIPRRAQRHVVSHGVGLGW